MPEIKSKYTTRVSGFWNTRHEIHGEDGLLGRLCVRRNPFGMVVDSQYRPEQGEVLDFRRDPGILRSQFSVWTEGGEWLGSSLRPGVLRREIQLHCGGRPYRLVPRPGFSRGWALYAPKTGLTAQVVVPLVGSSATIEVYRRLDFALVLLMYFLGYQVYAESLLPGPEGEVVMAEVERTTV